MYPLAWGLGWARPPSWRPGEGAQGGLGAGVGVRWAGGDSDKLPADCTSPRVRQTPWGKAQPHQAHEKGAVGPPAPPGEVLSRLLSWGGSRSRPPRTPLSRAPVHPAPGPPRTPLQGPATLRRVTQRGAPLSFCLAVSLCPGGRRALGCPRRACDPTSQPSQPSPTPCQVWGRHPACDMGGTVAAGQGPGTWPRGPALLPT